MLKWTSCLAKVLGKRTQIRLKADLREFSEYCLISNPLDYKVVDCGLCNKTNNDDDDADDDNGTLEAQLQYYYICLHLRSN